jgi:hypothetical protein
VARLASGRPDWPQRLKARRGRQSRATCSAAKKGHAAVTICIALSAHGCMNECSPTLRQAGWVEPPAAEDAKELCPGAFSSGDDEHGRGGIQSEPAASAGRAATPSAAACGPKRREERFPITQAWPIASDFRRPDFRDWICCRQQRGDRAPLRHDVRSGTPNSADRCRAGVQIRQPARVHYLGGRRRGFAARD